MSSFKFDLNKQRDQQENFFLIVLLTSLQMTPQLYYTIFCTKMIKQNTGKIWIGKENFDIVSWLLRRWLPQTLKKKS